MYREARDCPPGVGLSKSWLVESTLVGVPNPTDDEGWGNAAGAGALARREDPAQRPLPPRGNLLLLDYSEA